MITSKDNEQIKHIKSLFTKKYRDEFKEYIVEGIKMAREALEYAEVSMIAVSDIFEAKDEFMKISKDKGISLIEVSDKLFRSICDTETPQGILCVVKKEDTTSFNSFILNTPNNNTIFVLDNIQDPGNLGTIIRTLDSAGIDKLVLSQNTVDEYNPKVVRSTMGAIFRLKIYRTKTELCETLLSLKDEGYSIVVTSLDTDNDYYSLDFSKKIAVVIGNESQGVSKEVLDIADIMVKIPMIGKTESLNASVATSIIAYEKVRQSLTKD